MDFDLTFKGITSFLKKVTGVLIPLVSVSLLLGIIFGPDTPFIGDVYRNTAEIIKMLGDDGLLALISVIIILAYLKK
jgi:hypothetical protein